MFNRKAIGAALILTVSMMGDNESVLIPLLVTLASAWLIFGGKRQHD